MSKEIVTKWEDAGRDCGFCGGEIYKRTDIRSNETLDICYECQDCGAQWTFNGSLKRSSRSLKGQGTVVAESDSWADFKIPTWGWMLVAVFVTYVIIRLGFGFIRFLIPLILLAAVGYLVYSIGRDQEWW